MAESRQDNWMMVESGQEWALKVDLNSRIALAIKEIPYEGQLQYSTERRRNRPDKRSEFKLLPREVTRRFFSESDVDTEYRELLAKVRAYVDNPSGKECTKAGCDEGVCRQVEVNAPGRGHDFDYYCEAHGEQKRDGHYISDVRDLDSLIDKQE